MKRDPEVRKGKARRRGGREPSQGFRTYSHRQLAVAKQEGKDGAGFDVPEGRKERGGFSPGEG